MKILIDAVQAASFVTEKKTAELIDKIAALGGSHKADILKSNMACFNTRKHSNESIYYNVGFLEDAIQQQKRVIFYYYDLNENGEKVYRREHHHYVVEPIALVFNDDNYYLMVYSARHDGTANYRVDRMDHVEIVDEAISEKALTLREGIDSYTEQAFKMYGGQQVDVVLEFDDKLIGVVYDIFGEDTKMIRSGDKCIATVKVQISPVFWGWLFQFAGQMKVLSPDTVIADYSLMQFLVEVGPVKNPIITHLTDPIIGEQEGIQLDAAYDFEDYRAKVNRYVNEHGNTLVIYKLTHNIPLSHGDYQELERVLTSELGSKEDYEREFGDTPFGLLIRKIAKLDHDAAMEAFSQFINDQSLNQKQIAFLHKIINHIEQNGYMESVTMLTKPPFDKPLSFTRLFDKKMQIAIMAAINKVKDNAVVIAA